MKPTHDRARIAKLAAIVTGLLGVFLALATPLLAAVRAALESPAFRTVLDGLPGYDGSASGALETLF